jgi:hypothetical protein
MLTYLPTRSELTRAAKSLEVEVDVFHARRQLGGVVVTQPFRVEAGVEVALGGDEGAARFRHLCAVDRKKAVGEDLRRRAVAGVGQFGRPEQRVEVEDVLADEVVELGRRVRLEPFVEIEAVPAAQVLERAHVADRRVEPDVEVLARRIGDFEAEVGRVARNIPVGQLVFAGGAQPFLHLVGGLGLQHAVVATGVAAQEGFAARVGELEEIMLGGAQLRFGAGNGRIRFDEVGRRVGGAAGFAVVAILVLGVAFRALALDEAVGQEQLLDRVVILLDGARLDQPGGAQLEVDVVGAVAGFVAEWVV